MKHIFTWFAISLAATTCTLFAQVQSLDKVAVIVDQGVILESEIQQLVNQVKTDAMSKGQSLPSDRALRTQAIDRLVITNLQMQMAERMGIQVNDTQLDQTIQNILASEGQTVDQLSQALRNQGISIDAYRERIRQEMITGEVTRAAVRRRIYITDEEINALVELINEQGAAQAEYRIGHILIGLPSDPTDNEIADARDRADKVIALIKEGSDFAKIAIASSSGANALEGGDLGWLNINSMPTLFAEAVQTNDNNDLIGPIRSGAGFHILKVFETRGVERVTVEQVNARHILIQPSVILSEEKAEQMLVEFKQQLIAGEADFATLAKEHSKDPGSALKGGELGYADPEIYVPAFKDALAQLDVNEYSKPVRSVHGWHLIQLIDRRVDDATEERKRERAARLIFNRKFAEESEAWVRELRNAAYIELVDA